MPVLSRHYKTFSNVWPSVRHFSCLTNVPCHTSLLTLRAGRKPDIWGGSQILLLQFLYKQAKVALDSFLQCHLYRLHLSQILLLLLSIKPNHCHMERETHPIHPPVASCQHPVLKLSHNPFGWPLKNNWIVLAQFVHEEMTELHFGCCQSTWREKQLCLLGIKGVPLY